MEVPPRRRLRPARDLNPVSASGIPTARPAARGRRARRQHGLAPPTRPGFEPSRAMSLWAARRCSPARESREATKQDQFSRVMARTARHPISRGRETELRTHPIGPHSGPNRSLTRYRSRGQCGQNEANEQLPCSEGRCALRTCTTGRRGLLPPRSALALRPKGMPMPRRAAGTVSSLTHRLSLALQKEPEKIVHVMGGNSD